VTRETPAGGASRRPNILWICTDQQRWDTLSFLGHPGAVTPSIDALAGDGTAFDRAYCQSPICTPSRASFLTGRYPIAHQVHRNGNTGFPDHLPLLPAAFRDAGYRTGLIGKFHLSRAHAMVEKRPANDGYDEFYWSHHPDPDWPEGHDYQVWLDEKGVDAEALYDRTRLYGPGVPADLNQTAWAEDRAAGFIRRHAGAAPWFLTMNLFDPHPPFDPPEDYLDRFDPEAMPDPVFAETDLARQQRLRDIDNQTRDAVDVRQRAGPSRTIREGVTTHDNPPESYDARYIRACYHAMIAQIDDMVGRLRAVLAETGQERDTLVLFMSDHGEMLGDHGLIYKGCRFYEGLVHVPMIYAWPGRVRSGVVAQALVELIDIPETLLDAAGLPPMPGMQGRSLWPILTGAAGPDRHKPYVLCEYFDSLKLHDGQGSRGSMYFDGRHKLCVYHGTGLGELFDLETDPQELNDLWDDPGSAALKAELMHRHFDAMMLVSGQSGERTAGY